MKILIKIISLFFISMATSLGFSTFQNMENMGNKVNKTKHQKTLKRRRKKVDNFLNSMGKEGLANSAGRNPKSGAPSGPDPDEDDDDVEIGEPYVNPHSKPVEKDAGTAKTLGNLTAQTYDPKALENFGLLKEGIDQQQKYLNEQQQFYNQYVPTYTGTAQNIPYYSQLANSQNLSGPTDELMQKLNYVVHMLEGQKDEKTGNVTEELVLYMFLGVFVIFVVDSFARAGKYTR